MDLLVSSRYDGKIHKSGCKINANSISRQEKKFNIMDFKILFYMVLEIYKLPKFNRVRKSLTWNEKLPLPVYFSKLTFTL